MHAAAGFRPLIRGFFFYTLRNKDYPFMIANVFPSPHSGILFLSKMYELNIQADNEFPSPHSGILFLFSRGKGKKEIDKRVSVPSFGDSFFIVNTVSIYHMTVSFPSPHSGILFLCMRNGSSQSAALVSVPSFGDSFFIRYKR